MRFETRADVDSYRIWKADIQHNHVVNNVNALLFSRKQTALYQHIKS